MLSFPRSIALLFLTLSAAALATPHGVHNVHHHRSVAAHMVAPVAREPIVAERSVKRRRSNGRCVQKHASESHKKPANTAAPNGAGSSSSNSVKQTEQLKNPAQPKSTEAPKATGAPTPDPPKGSGGGGGGSGGGSGPTFTGQGTFYDTGLGACGITNHNSDHIVAVSHLLFDTFPGFNGGNPNNNPVCNKQIIASRNGKSTTVTVTDRCAACQMHDLDFAPAAFNDIADPALGRVSITWRWA